MWNGRARAVCRCRFGVRWGDKCGASMWGSPALSHSVMAKHINNLICYWCHKWAIFPFPLREVTVQCGPHRAGWGSVSTGSWARDFWLKIFPPTYTSPSCCPKRVTEGVWQPERHWRLFCDTNLPTIVPDKETEMGPWRIFSINTSAAPDMHMGDYN